MKKKYSMKILSFLLSCAVLCGSAGILVSAGTGEEREAERLSAAAAGSEAEDQPLHKSETVYVLTNADGSVRNIIVSDWIKNALAGAAVKDKTELQNIRNLKGEEGFAQNGGETLWDAQGKDIYYQGTIAKELPVDLSVQYLLDGREISYGALLGQSGSVTIRFVFTNRQYEMVSIDGTQEKIYVPFAVLTGFVLDNAVFRNISVSNGKIVNDGDHTIVAGIAFPGLSQSLALDASKLEIPETIELTADVADFRFGTAYTLATNEIFNQIDLSDGAGSADALKNALSGLTAAVRQLTDGSSALYDGLSALMEKSGELAAGSDRLTDGAGSLSSGAAELQAGAAALAEGLKTLNAKNAALTGAAKQVFESLLAAADAQIAAAGLRADRLTPENYNTVLDTLLASLDEAAVRKAAYDAALQKVEAAVRAQENQIRIQTEAAIRKNVLEKILQAADPEMTAEEYEAAADAQMQTAAVRALVAQNTEDQIQMLIAQNIQSRDIVSQINDAVNTAKNGAASLTALKTQLRSYHEFYSGVFSYTEGAADAGAGADRLLSGAAVLSDGAQELYAGALTLRSGIKAFTEGIAQLKDGALQLSDGLREFDEQGVRKLTDAAEGGVKGLLERVRAIAEVSRAYRSFAGISDEMEGSVRFIYKTDAVQ